MFSFTKNRFAFYGIALTLLVLSLLSPWIVKLNMGIDMTGGLQIEYSVDKGDVLTVIADVKDSLGEKAKGALDETQKKLITDIVAYRISGTNSFVIEAGVAEESQANNLISIEKAKTVFTAALQKELSGIKDTTITQSRYVNIGASFGSYIKTSGFRTLIGAIIFISIYIMYAFWGSIQGMASWPFAVVTGVSLIHDVVIAFGLYVFTSALFPEFKIDTFFITAMLTVLGYSINDTIVVMDRIRSNLHEGSMKKMKFSDLIDKSIKDTMRRSLFTSLTVIIVLIAMFIWGPSILKGFTLALIYGGIVGTYSSICIASPLLIDITGKK